MNTDDIYRVCRGKDLNGTVIILCKYDIPDSPRLTRMIQGSANQLVSQFRLTYHMICNLHKTCKSDETDIEKFLERSFGEHNRLKQSADVMKELDSLRQQIETFAIQQCPQCSDIDGFCVLFDQYVECLQSFAEVLDITPVQEGIIVRCIQRLDELLKYIKMAANKMGNKELEEKAREKMLIKEFLRLFVGLKALLLFLKP
ncbi:unnamed protein product [Medioppia subpectinata]|uniref:ATP-dependent RNA helicase Ski2/MTR4 C-terminal domain-containing protein n=1 Tax=Medioppia subpectinata TaxID=1979941 RepID=A0A7R9KN67_9ACAR|nr:unnamed protein product [Medioppia subpectinata]CAG2106674.1 unnamed protein product [Medioppia subpectinata]